MVATLETYAQERGYELAACFGLDDRNTHCYYVRTGFPQSAEIVASIRRIDYHWNGERASNFALADASGAASTRQP
jgi:hypothetical protein